jgi:hypothetical protein
VDALLALWGAARDAIRIAGLLLAFLEVIRDDDGVPLPEAAVFRLSEMHMAQQKLRLLADCGRKGVWLWVLMNAEAAVSELRVVMWSVATTVDVLLGPVAEAAPAEARDLTRMVSAHAWCAAAQLRPDP